MILDVNGGQWQFSIAMLSCQRVTPWNLQGNCMEYYSPGEWKPLPSGHVQIPMLAPRVGAILSRKPQLGVAKNLRGNRWVGIRGSMRSMMIRWKKNHITPLKKTTLRKPH